MRKKATVRMTFKRQAQGWHATVSQNRDSISAPILIPPDAYITQTIRYEMHPNERACAFPPATVLPSTLISQRWARRRDVTAPHSLRQSKGSIVQLTEQSAI